MDMREVGVEELGRAGLLLYERAGGCYGHVKVAALLFAMTLDRIEDELRGAETAHAGTVGAPASTVRMSHATAAG